MPTDSDFASTASPEFEALYATYALATAGAVCTFQPDRAFFGDSVTA